ncbi:MAG: rhomboid family intramembrane serine protease [Deltaproteobacteria bacterium]|nr:MAG: rhomboid family intramembrane serine protease [Deltaproteobacteria bacterium]
MRQEQRTFAYRKPSKPLLWLMVALGCIWVMFAVSVNWAGAGQDIFVLLAGDSQAVLSGQLWRLITASLLHTPNSPWHPLVVIMLLFFFAPTLEERWGPKRLFIFFAASSAFAYAIESVGYALLPEVANRQWYGGMVIADAATVAWAFSARNQIVRLFFVLPMRPLVMVGLLAVFHILLVIARSPYPEGMFAPFGAMAAGYLFCDSSPLRRYYLKLKLARLQSEVQSLRKNPKKRRRSGGPDLRVIPGGADDDDEPPDKSMLN